MKACEGAQQKGIREKLKVKALFLDFDGVTVDTEVMYFRLLQKVGSRHQLDFPLEGYVHHIGKYKSPEVLGKLCGCPEMGATLREEWSRELDSMTSALPLRPGVRDYLERGRALDLKTALVSACPKNRLQQLLSFADQRLFDRIFSAEDVVQAKPHPEVYRLSLRTFGLAPQQALAFEDSPNGVMAAKAAGIPCIIVESDITKNAPFGLEQMKIPSMDAVPLDILLHQTSMDAVPPHAK